jgi:Domain of unknown function (DUF4190)
MNCSRCASDNAPGTALCVRCGAPLPLGPTSTGQPAPSPYGAPPPPAGYGGYPPPGYSGYPPPGYPGNYYQQPMPFQAQRTSGMAIAGFVLSLVFCGLMGLIFSVMGNNEIKRSNGTVGGGGLAIAGIVIGIIRIIIEVIYLVVIIAVISNNGHL